MGADTICSLPVNSDNFHETSPISANSSFFLPHARPARHAVKVIIVLAAWNQIATYQQAVDTLHAADKQHRSLFHRNLMGPPAT
jgi:hypothetical protein